MRYALIIAGGSGTRLWPMSTQALPKQLLPLFDGRCLLELAVDRLKCVLPEQSIYLCAGESHRQVIQERLNLFPGNRFIAEPVGRDTLNAVALGTAAIQKHDPEAVVGIFTADHMIEPVDTFAAAVEQGYGIAEKSPQTLVTFGITPTHPATGYGYLELGESVDGETEARRVTRFREKPDKATATQFVEAGPDKYLWNAGMFIWRADTLMSCVQQYAPDNAVGLAKIVEAWGTGRQSTVLAEIYPTLPKISVDYAIMEPASEDPTRQVASVPMTVNWLDVGSWPAYAQTLTPDRGGNRQSISPVVHLDSKNVLTVSDDPHHLIATIGCEDITVIRTAHATLICKTEQAQQIKQLHEKIQQQFGNRWL